MSSRSIGSGGAPPAPIFSSGCCTTSLRIAARWTNSLVVDAVVIAALIIVVWSILLLMKAISAEAGLPVLSGVSGFAIARELRLAAALFRGPTRQEEEVVILADSRA